MQYYEGIKQLHYKSPNVTGLVTKRPKYKGASQGQRHNKRQESQSLSINSVRLNHAQHENNRSPFSVFGGSTRAGFIVKTDDPPLAGSTELAGRIWPVGRTCRPLSYNT